MVIRHMTKNDLQDLVRLMGDLGYPTTIGKLAKRLTAISSQDNYYTLVAESDGKVV